MIRPTQLFHYSEEPLVEIIQDFHAIIRAREPFCMKPFGFWVSIEDYPEDQTWKTWCEQEEFRLDDLKHRYHIKLKENSNILYLNTSQEIIDFSLKYAANDPYDFGRFMRDPKRPPYVYKIEWDKLSEEYDGILIAPYQWSCRLMNPTTTWYYGWDCASGCIWNVDCIESFTLHQAEENAMDLQQEV